MLALEDFSLLNLMVGEVLQEYLSMYSWSILRFHLDVTSPSFVHLVQTFLFLSSNKQKSLRGFRRNLSSYDQLVGG